MSVKKDLMSFAAGLGSGTLIAAGEVYLFDNYAKHLAHSHGVNALESIAYSGALFGYDAVFKSPLDKQEIIEKSISRTLGFMLGQTLVKYLF